jgi:hypothetical protein
MKVYIKGELVWNDDAQRYEGANETTYEYSGNLALAKGEQQTSSGGTQTQVTEPWSVQIPYLTQGFSTAKNLLLDSPPPGYYPNSTVAPFSPEKETALQLQTMRALTGSPLQPMSNALNMATMSGAYLPANNPFNTTLNQEYEDPTNSAGFNAMFDSAARKITPMVDSVFERSGRLNSGLAQQAKTQALSDAFANQYMQDKNLTLQDRAMRAQNFGNERENQMRAMMFSPQLAANDYLDFSTLGEVGDVRDAMASQVLGDDVNRYNYNQNIMQDQLAKFMQLIGGNYGGTTVGTTDQTQSSSGGKSGFSSGLGGALGGYSLASKISGFNPLFGAAMGGLGGLLDF